MRPEKPPPDDEVMVRVAPAIRSVPLVTLIIRRTSLPGVVVPGFAATAIVNGGYGFTLMVVVATPLRLPDTLAMTWIRSLMVDVTVGAVKLAT